MKAIVIGASGGIGAAVVQRLEGDSRVSSVQAISRSGQTPTSAKTTTWPMDITDEASIEGTARQLKPLGPFDLVFMATGFLHDDDYAPEKSSRDMTAASLQRNFSVNSFGPALAAKHFLPLLRPDNKSVFAALSARVGSISDNRLGGWYAYRASKAALNMILKTLAIEYARKRKHMIILGLHPGTVDTPLSEPFQRNVPSGKLFTADYSAERLLSVIENAQPADSGALIAWDGQTISF